jgi:hypothetical protein
VDARVRVLDAAGARVAETRSDARANFRIEVPATAPFPLILVATGGTDVVTERPPDFTLRAAVTDPARPHANLTPLGTLAVGALACAGAPLTTEELGNAWARIAPVHGFGLDPRLVPDPLTTPVDAARVATVVRATEAAGEFLRRTAALAGTDDVDAVVDALACDLVDGVIDGRGGAVDGRDPALPPPVVLAAQSRVAGASVLVETLANRLRVDGEPVAEALDAALALAVPAAAGTRLAAEPIPPELLAEARTALVTALAILRAPAYAEVLDALERIAPGALPTEAAALLGEPALAVDAGSLAAALATLDPGALEALLAPNQRGEAASPPALSLAADPAAILPDAQTVLRWSAPEAVACGMGPPGTDALLEAEGRLAVGPFPESTELTVSCWGPGGSVRDTVRIEVQPPPAPRISVLEATPVAVAWGATVTVSWNATDAEGCTAAGDAPAWAGALPGQGSRTLGPLRADTRLALACTGPGGLAERSLTVAVAPPPPPQVELATDVTRAGAGRPVRLTWNARNADRCRAEAAPALAIWSGPLAPSGTVTVPTLGADTRFTLACEGPGGTGSGARTVTFVPEPTLALGAGAAVVPLGQSVTVTWSTTDADTCEAVATPALAGWSGTLPPGGTRAVGPLEVDVALALVCTGEGGIVSDGVELRVDAGPPELALRASAASVDTGGTVTLEWSAEKADACEASGAWRGARPLAGTVELGPVTEDRTFTLECTGVGGTALSTQTVVVRAARLSWTPPTETVDGAPLPGLSGYRVYYGTASRDYTRILEVDDPAADRWVVEGLAPGTTWYFAVTAVDPDGRESAFSNEGSKAIP